MLVLLEHDLIEFGHESLHHIQRMEAYILSLPRETIMVVSTLTSVLKGPDSSAERSTFIVFEGKIFNCDGLASRSWRNKNTSSRFLNAGLLNHLPLKRLFFSVLVSIPTSFE